MIKLRQLEKKDAPYMLEWMHDADIQRAFIKNMMDVSLEDAEKFCEMSAIPDTICDGDNLHFAIADENDEYLGTISLKHIDLTHRNTELAISTRKCVHGTGLAEEAMRAVLQKAFTEYELNRVFLYVIDTNTKAIKYYEKCGFKREGSLRNHLYAEGAYHDWIVYGILKDEFNCDR